MGPVISPRRRKRRPLIQTGSRATEVDAGFGPHSMALISNISVCGDFSGGHLPVTGFGRGPCVAGNEDRTNEAASQADHSPFVRFYCSTFSCSTLSATGRGVSCGSGRGGLGPRLARAYASGCAPPCTTDGLGTSRRPRKSRRYSGSLASRKAAWQSLALLYQEPPRFGQG